MRTFFSSFLVVLPMLVFPLATSFAQWSTVDTVNNPICAATGNQDSPAMVSDGAGGAIIAWEDDRGSYYNIYV